MVRHGIMSRVCNIAETYDKSDRNLLALPHRSFSYALIAQHNVHSRPLSVKERWQNNKKSHAITAKER